MSEVTTPWAMVAHIGLALKLDEKQCEEIGKIAAQWSSDMTTCAELFAQCESPVERLFLLAPFLSGCAATAPRQNKGQVQASVSGGSVYIQPQFKVLGFEDDASLDECKETVVARADFEVFLVRSSDDFSAVLVEIDGHDFHEKTKEQVARGKARDRMLTRLGYRVLHFSGAEVYASPQACFNEVVQTLQDVADFDSQIRWRAREEGVAAGYAQRGQALALVTATNQLGEAAE